MSLLTDDQCRVCFHDHTEIDRVTQRCAAIAHDPGPDDTDIESVCGCPDYVDLEAESRIVVKPEVREVREEWMAAGYKDEEAVAAQAERLRRAWPEPIAYIERKTETMLLASTIEVGARYRNALEDMVRQHAYWSDSVGGLWTGGLSTNEDAFDVLGWHDDPHPMPDMRCDEPDCLRLASIGTPTPDGYRHTCSEHKP